MPQPYDDILIDIKVDEPLRSSPALGHIDKLLKQSALETQSLQVVRRMMMRDMLDRAQVTGITKLNAAAKQRKMLTGTIDETAAEPLKKKRKKKNRDGKKPRAERIEQLRQYLQQHPGEDTLTIAAGLNWRSNQVLKFAPEVATSKSQGRRNPLQWFPKTTKKTVMKKSRPKLDSRKPLQERQAAITAFLSQHPEAYTKEVAKALAVKPNSHFVKALRTVARPLRATTATQPIQWVLAQAS